MKKQNKTILSYEEAAKLLNAEPVVKINQLSSSPFSWLYLIHAVNMQNKKDNSNIEKDK